jgi:hypothetical protein
LLSGIESVRVNREELHLVLVGNAFRKRVVRVSGHVERLVIDLGFAAFLHIVIAKHGVKVDAALEQFGIRVLELGRQMGGTAVRIDVVAERQDDVIRIFIVPSHHPAGDGQLIVITCAHIAERGEPHRACADGFGRFIRLSCCATDRIRRNDPDDERNREQRYELSACHVIGPPGSDVCKQWREMWEGPARIHKAERRRIAAQIINANASAVNPPKGVTTVTVCEGRRSSKTGQS